MFKNSHIHLIVALYLSFYSIIKPGSYSYRSSHANALAWIDNRLECLIYIYQCIWRAEFISCVYSCNTSRTCNNLFYGNVYTVTFFLTIFFTILLYFSWRTFFFQLFQIISFKSLIF